MNLSSNELFHFTEFKYLKSILKSKSFFPRYNLEFTHLSDNFQGRAAFAPIAMVCFCDIPFEFSLTHRRRYGNYGIVLTENWKLKKGLNPVIYIQSESHLANIFANFANMTNYFIPLIENKENEINVSLTLSNVAKNLIHLTFFLKQFENKDNKFINYEGKIRKFEKRKFYDEREWRYIPFEANIKNELLIRMQVYDNPDKLERANKMLEKYKLNFEIDDIKYLIVNNENEKQELNNLVNEIFKQEIDIKIVE